MPTATLSYASLRNPGAPLVPRAHLFVALECSRPLAGSSRHALDGLHEVAIGRSSSRTTRRGAQAGARTLTLSLPDPRMSSSHARIARRGSEWVLEDRGSKNGAFVNGVRETKRALADGDLILLGHTLFLFRSKLPTAPDSPEDVTAGAVPSAISTLIPELSRALDALVEIARSNVHLLFLGETGTGKEVLSRAVHALSERSGDFVAINCGALPATLVESTLFGHKRGAFSGAVAEEVGLLRSADRGTVLLDEIGDLPSPAQAALLRVLQESEVLPVGGTRPVKLDVRVIAATHRDLEAAVAQNAFREDLFARLAGHVFEEPSLRDRREDIGLLASAILRRIEEERGSEFTFTPEAGAALFRHSWPRNVRELEKSLHRACVLAKNGAIGEGDLALVSAPTGEPRSKEELMALLQRHRGNISTVAAEMGTSRSQVHRLIKRLELDLDAFRS
jgi:transcriptional regulator of acetoin/glycerol metabolism